MTAPPARVAHLFPARTLARLLVPTYAAALQVDDEEAHDRLTEALRAPALVTALQEGLTAALAEARGPRTSEDKLLDRISAGIATRGGSLRACPTSPAVSAVMVRINLEIGIAPEPMREVLATARGAAVLGQGLREICAQLVKELSR